MEHSANQNHPKRQVQNVSTKSQRKLVIDWMVTHAENVGNTTRIAAKAVSQFPQIFRSKSRANREKAHNWWKTRHNFYAKLRTSEDKAMTVVSRRIPGLAVTRVPINAFKGRGRKRAPWVDYVHTVLMVEFERLRSAGMELDRTFLQEIALHTITESDCPFPLDQVESEVGRPIAQIINSDWIEAFVNRAQIVTRKQSGSLTRSANHTAYTEALIAYHLGQVERDFQSGVLDKNMIENMDETHFVFNQDNHQTLGFIGEEKVNYADVVSGGEGMTMVLRITGGPDSKIEAPFIIFKNRNSNYPILGVPDDVPGVSYRTGPRGWMSKELFLKWLHEPRAFTGDPHGRLRLIFMENASGHLETPAQVQALQPRLEKGMGEREGPENSGRRLVDRVGQVQKSRETLFLKLAARCIEQVNSMTDGDGISYSRKAMIRSGLSLDMDGTWKVSQLFPHLQDIIKRHHMNFCGVVPEYSEME